MMMESQRLSFVIRNQPLLRCDKYKALDDAVRTGDFDPTSNVGKWYVLPSSFIGSPRYMIQNFQDVMAICKVIGYPELFITFTCNPKWLEVVCFIESRGLRPEDRPDIMSCIFKMKLDELMRDLKTKNVFGKSIGGNFIFKFE